jgi:hypothetical protein
MSFLFRDPVQLFRPPARPASAANYTEEPICLEVQKAGAASYPGGDFVRSIAMTRVRSNTSFRCRLLRSRLLAEVCCSYLCSSKVAFLREVYSGTAASHIIFAQ